MWGRTAVFVSVCSLLLVGGSLGAMAQVGERAGLGEAYVVVTLTPTDPLVEGAGEAGLNVAVEGALACTPGSPPAPLRLTILPEDESLQLAIDPSSWVLEWEQSGGGDEIRYAINESRDLQVTVLSSPVERTVAGFVPLVQVDGGTQGLHCTQQGYAIQQQDQQREPFTVEPAPAHATDDDVLSTGPFNWVPLAMALVLLAVVALFAFGRERQRNE